MANTNNSNDQRMNREDRNRESGQTTAEDRGSNSNRERGQKGGESQRRDNNPGNMMDQEDIDDGIRNDL